MKKLVNLLFSARTDGTIYIKIPAISEQIIEQAAIDPSVVL